MSGWQDAPLVETAAPSGGGGSWQDAPLVERGTGEPDSPNRLSGNRIRADLQRFSGAAPATVAPGTREVPLAARPLVGINEGIANTYGTPVDLYSRLIGQPFAKAVTGREQQDLPGGSETIKRGMGLIGANPNDVRPPQTGPEKWLQGAGEGVGSMMGGGLVGEALLAGAVKESASFGNMLTNIIRGSGETALARTGSNALIGAGTGLVGEVASEAVPEPYKGAAKLVGGLVGGGVGAGVSAIAETGARAFSRPKVAAAQQILDRTGNPQTLRGKVDELVEQGPAVDKSNPNMYQLTGDDQIGEFQREVATANAGRHVTLLGQQSAARTKAMNEVADPNNPVQAVGDYIRQRLNQITEDTGADVAKARLQAEGAVSERLGTTQRNAEDFVEGLRDIKDVGEAKKAALSKVFQALDPDNSIVIDMSPLAAKRGEIKGAMRKADVEPTGAEAKIYDVIDNKLSGVEPFAELQAVRTSITDALREARLDPKLAASGRRLVPLLKAVDNMIAGEGEALAANPTLRGAIVDGLSAAERPAMRDAIWSNADHDIPVQVNPAHGQSRGADGRMYQEVTFEGRPSFVPADELKIVERQPGVTITGGSATEPARMAPGIEALPEVPTMGPTTNATKGIAPEVADQYAAARKGWADVINTYERGPVGKMMKPGEQFGSYKMTGSNVLDHIIETPENLRAFVAAADGNTDVLNTLKDGIAFSLRKDAVKDGLLSPSRYDKWVADHEYVFRQFPDLAERFGSVRAAQDTMDAAIANQKTALEQFQTASVKKFLADKDPYTALDQAMQTPQAFRSLVDTVKQDPNALAGLKRLAVELIMRKGGVTAENGVLSGAKEAGSTEIPQMAANAMQKFYINKRSMLADLLDEDQLTNIDAVIKDFQQAARSVKIPDSSGSPQDMRGLTRSLLPFLQNIAGGMGAGAASGVIIDPIIGTALGAAGGIIKSLYQGRVDRAAADFMLDPRKFAEWAPKTSAPSEFTMVRRMRVLLGQEALQGIETGANSR